MCVCVWCTCIYMIHFCIFNSIQNLGKYIVVGQKLNVCCLFMFMSIHTFAKFNNTFLLIDVYLPKPISLPPPSSHPSPDSRTADSELMETTYVLV